MKYTIFMQITYFFTDIFQYSSHTGGRVSILPSGELHIRDVRELDGLYQYRCYTRNRLTGKTKSSQAARLTLAGKYAV